MQSTMLSSLLPHSPSITRAKRRLSTWALGALIAASFPAFAAAGGQVVNAFGELPTKVGVQESQVRLLTENNLGWYARWYMLQRAKKTLDVTYFILEDDIFGKAFLGMLLKKAEEGVKVRLLVDARGSTKMTKRIFSMSFLKALARLENVEVRIFNPIHEGLKQAISNIRNVLASNHDKIILVDGDWALTGGRNVAAAYFAHPEDRKGVFRDTDVLMRGGNIAVQMKEAFDEEFLASQRNEVDPGWISDWEDQKQELELSRRIMSRWMAGRGLWNPEDLSRPLAKTVRKLNEEIETNQHMTAFLDFAQDPWSGRRSYPVKILDKHSFRGERNDITGRMVELVDQAEKSLIIQNPYVVLTQEVMEALLRADQRGVEVTLHTNSPITDDALVTQSFFLRDWWKLLRDMRHLRIFALQTEGVMLHAKTFVIDDEVTSIGTYNLDPMSQLTNGEVMVLIASPDFARRSRLRIERDITEASKEYRIEKDAEGRAVLDEKGKVKVLCGPEEDLKGFKGKVIRSLAHLKFLRPLI